MAVLIALILLDLVAIAGAIFLILSVTGWLSTGVPFVPTATSLVEPLTRMLQLAPGSVLYDLGCGDGKVLYALARAEPGARYVGAEKATLPYLFSFARRLVSRAKNVVVLNKDFSDVSLADATHVYLYLLPEVMDAIHPRLSRELRPGTCVVACDFVFHEREPSEVLEVGKGNAKHTLRLYEF